VGTRLFILPHTLIGIGVLVFVIGEPVLLALTPSTPGVVTHLSTRKGSKGAMTYLMDFDYSPAGGAARAAHDQETITREEFQTLHPGGRVMVRAAGVGRFHYVVLARSRGAYVRNRVALWIWAIFWNGIMCFVVYAVWVVPARHRKLVSIGRPVAGKISARYVTRGKSTSYQVKYTFTTSDIPPEQQQGKMTTTRAQYDALAVGDIVTVLYDPNRPAHHVVYECGEFKAETI
jgi:hypothetical protein